CSLSGFVSMFKLANKVDRISPFYAMELVKHAAVLEAQGRDIVHMSIGEPDFTAIDAVVQALEAAVRAGQTQYTAAVGLPMLRQAIAAFYETRFGAKIDPARVIVTAGASGALMLAMT